MNLRVHPDPNEPAGGYAFVELPEGSLPDGSVPVSVFDAFGERWLARPGEGKGDVHWQSEPVEFGPYEVRRHQGADWVRIGPEIVDRLEEYAALRLVVAGRGHDVIWPDDVPPRARPAVLGALQPVPRLRNDPTEPQTVMADPLPPVPETRADGLPEAGNVRPERASGPEPATRKNGRLLLALLMIALVVVAGLIWFLWPADDDAPRATAKGDPCSRETLAQTPGGYGAIIAAIRACGVDVQPDTALSLVEEGAAAGDAAALLLFGTLYDGTALDARIENLTGLTFADDPAQAAAYYARAAGAGSQEAETRLRDICRRLASSAATLSKGAYDDYCS